MDEIRVTEVLKVDAKLGLVFGFGLICKSGGKDYYDLHGHHIPEAEMLKGATEFAQASVQPSTDMHDRTEEGEVVQDGDVVFMFPMTADIAKALEIETKRTGLLVALKPTEEVFKMFETGKRQRVLNRNASKGELR